MRAAFDWAVNQPLHAVTALTYARIVADSRATRVFKDGPNRWRLLNNGDCRTFRLAGERLKPNLAACKGVTGYNTANGSLYVHTSGLPETLLVLSETPAERLHLVSSSGEIEFAALSEKRAAFEVHDLRPVTVVLGGAPARENALVSIDGIPSTQSAGDDGRLTLTLSNNATVTLEFPNADTTTR